MKLTAHALFLFALAFVCARCKPSQLGASAAESAYTGQLLRCVDQATSLAESRACRQRVDKEWGITEVATDGGAR